MTNSRKFYTLKFTIGKDTFKEIKNLSTKELTIKIPELFKEYYGFENVKVSYDKVWNLANRPNTCDLLFVNFVKISVVN